mmetsp:Transcript_108712/g.316304  ORF Transcript_108712/g.316304 Transcript_108712/m.316304 type:complete len:363 (+) Transcript_108712:226-1314(+)
MAMSSSERQQEQEQEQLDVTHETLQGLTVAEIGLLCLPPVALALVCVVCSVKTRREQERRLRREQERMAGVETNNADYVPGEDWYVCHPPVAPLRFAETSTVPRRPAYASIDSDRRQLPNSHAYTPVATGCHTRRHPAHAADPHAACCDACDACDADCGMMCRAAVLSPICMEPSSYGCETMCGHAFCTLCLSTYWKSLPQGTSRPLNCPYCRRQVTLLVANFSPEELANVETTRLRQAELDEYNSMHGVCYSYRVQQPLTIATSNPCTTHDLQSHDHAPTHAALQGGRDVGPIQYLTHMRVLLTALAREFARRPVSIALSMVATAYRLRRGLSLLVRILHFVSLRPCCLVPLSPPPSAYPL